MSESSYVNPYVDIDWVYVNTHYNRISSLDECTASWSDYTIYYYIHSMGIDDYADIRRNSV